MNNCNGTDRNESIQLKANIIICWLKTFNLKWTTMNPHRKKYICEYIKNRKRWKTFCYFKCITDNFSFLLVVLFQKNKINMVITLWEINPQLRCSIHWLFEKMQSIQKLWMSGFPLTYYNNIRNQWKRDTKW